MKRNYNRTTDFTNNRIYRRIH